MATARAAAAAGHGAAAPTSPRPLPPCRRCHSCRDPPTSTEVLLVEASAAIEPLQRVEPLLLRFRTHYRVAQMRMRASRMIDVFANSARLQLHAGGAEHTS